MLLGNTYLELEDGTSAAEQFLLARKDGALDSFVIAPLARTYVLQEQYEEALRKLSKADKYQSIVAQIGVIRGDTHLALKHFAKAENNYLEASKIRSKNSRSLNGLARIKIATKYPIGAADYFNQALETKQADLNAWFAKGEIARLRCKAEEALPRYDRAIKLAPRFVAPCLARARIIIDRGKHLDAEPDILAIRGIDVQNPHAAFLHALILARKDKAYPTKWFPLVG